MADNVTTQTATLATIPNATKIASAEVSFSGDTAHAELVGIVGVDGTEGSRTATIIADGTNGLLVNLGTNNDVTVTGTVTSNAGSGPWPVTDNSGSLTVDNAALAVTGGGVEASALRVTLANDSTGLISVDDNGGSLTVDGTVAVSGTVTVGSHAVTNAGTFATQVDGAALTALQLIDDPVIADDAAFTPATSKVMMAGFEADEASTDSVDEGDAGAARMTLDRKIIVTPQPHTAGGVTTYHLASAGSTNATVVKASAGQLYGWYIYNSNAAARKVAFHNASSTPTAGASIYFSLVIPPTAAANLMGSVGIAFSTGIAITTVTGLADSDSTGVAANDLIINLWYA